MDICIRKGNTIPTKINVPTSKSLAHRAMMVASFCQGVSHIFQVVKNQDTLATQNALKHFGVQIDMHDDDMTIKGQSTYVYDGLEVDCNESGSTLRFMIPLAARLSTPVTFTGKKRLLERPQNVYQTVFSKSQLRFEHTGEKIVVQGPLQPGVYHVKGNVSSQFITGLMMALSTLENASRIIIEDGLESASYVQLTIDVLAKANVNVTFDGYQIDIPVAKLQPFDYVVEADCSSAAFLLALGAISDYCITITNLNLQSHQSDLVMLDFLKQMQANIIFDHDGVKVTKSQLQGITIDLKDCPDLGPILFALATQCETPCHFINYERLRIKESDRVESMRVELEKLGTCVEVLKEEVIVYPCHDLRTNVTLDGHNDHRIAMALSVLCAKSDEKIRINGAQCVDKSYPTFYEDLKKIGVTIEEL